MNIIYNANSSGGQTLEIIEETYYGYLEINTPTKYLNQANKIVGGTWYKTKRVPISKRSLAITKMALKYNEFHKQNVDETSYVRQSKFIREYRDLTKEVSLLKQESSEEYKDGKATIGLLNMDLNLVDEIQGLVNLYDANENLEISRIPQSSYAVNENTFFMKKTDGLLAPTIYKVTAERTRASLTELEKHLDI